MLVSISTIVTVAVIATGSDAQDVATHRQKGGLWRIFVLAIMLTQAIAITLVVVLIAHSKQKSVLQDHVSSKTKTPLPGLKPPKVPCTACLRVSASVFQPHLHF